MTCPPPSLFGGWTPLLVANWSGENGLNWTFAIEPLTAAGLLLAAVCCAALGLWWNPPPGGRGRRTTIVLLRLIAVAALASFALNPEQRGEAQSEPAPLTVLLDLSDSMASGGPDRLAAARGLIRRWGEPRPLTIRPFAATVGPPLPGEALNDAGMLAGIELDRTGSDPAAAVRAALGEPAVRRAGALAIVTDGRSTVGPAGRLSSVADAAREAGVRLLIIGAGEPDPWGAPKLASLVASRPLGPGEPVNVSARWTFADGVPTPAPRFTATLTNEADGTPVAAGRATIGPNGVARFDAMVVPPQAGAYRYALALSARGEPIPAAADAVSIDVPGGALRVLLIADRPRHEARFLQSLLEREPTLEATVIVGDDPLPAAPRPPDGEPFDREPFDVLVTIGAVPERLSPAPAGGRIVVHSLPTTGNISGAQPADPAAVVATAAGRRLGLFNAAPPPVFGIAPAEQSDPAAATLATAGGTPFVTLRRTADGTRIDVGAPQTWRWRGLGAGEEGDAHRRFWLAAVRLAAASPEETPALRVEPTTIEAGGVATVVADGSGATGVQIAGPGVTRSQPLGPAGSATIAGLPPGQFELTPIGGEGGPGATLTVTDPPAEGDVTSLNRADLEQAAEASGGRFLLLADAGGAEEFLP
ncbi:vWA domain-containing protein, partial [Alienimonas chondri]|uniref:vWA domain-containing protein n=1 Tax=Alienimonas chondri TaxID=2681879 RepID=UPI0014887108